MTATCPDRTGSVDRGRLTSHAFHVNTVHVVASENADTRTRLLRHARDVYLEGGPAHFSLREVARRAGISAAAVYRHFDDKDDLLSAVCSEGFQIFYGYLMRALAEPTPIDRLRAAIDLYRRFAVENPRDYRVIFMTAREDSSVGTSRKAAPPTSPTFQFLVDRVRECIDVRDIAHGDAVEIAVNIWAHVHGLASLRLSGHLAPIGNDAAFARFFRTSTDRLLRGLAP